jgi:hypothetical protein
LQSKARDLITTNFCFISSRADCGWLELAADELRQVLVTVELEVCSEMAVIESIVAWARAMPQARSAEMVELLCDPLCVRLALAPKQSVREFVGRVVNDRTGMLNGFDERQVGVLVAHYQAWLDVPLPLVVDHKCPFMSCSGTLGDANVVDNEKVCMCVCLCTLKLLFCP